MATISPRGVIILILVFFLLFGPDSQPAAPTQPSSSKDTIAKERQALDDLERSHYGDLNAREGQRLNFTGRPSNLTGLREENGYAWRLLEDVKSRVKEQAVSILGEHAAGALEGFESDVLPLYHNVSGYLRGKWVRSKVAEGVAAPQVDWATVDHLGRYSTHECNRNISGVGGNVRIEFEERDSFKEVDSSGGTVRFIKAGLTIRDESSWGDGWNLVLRGVHFLRSGSILLTTTSEKFAGIFALPHFSLTNSTFTASRQLLNETLRSVIERQEVGSLPEGNPWSSSTDGSEDDINSVPHCEFIVYLQQHPLPFRQPAHHAATAAGNVLAPLEEELRFPTGYVPPIIPDMTMSMVIFSPDCGFVLESKGPPEYPPQTGHHLQGPKIEMLISTGRHHVLVFAVIMGLQILLMVRQMKEASTPSTRSRISFYTIAMLSMGDGFACFAILPVAMFVDSTFLPLFTTAFLAFMAVTFFDLRFLMDIWSVQAQERRRQQRAQASTRTATPAQPQDQDLSIPALSAAGADTLPLPVTARQAVNSGATPVILPPDQDEPDQATGTTTTNNGSEPTRRELGALYTRFYLLLLALFFLSIYANSWPRRLRTFYANALAFTYLSFWLLQIYRNTMRNCRKALQWRFVIGQSVLRLLPFAYFYALPNNIMFFENDGRALLGLVGWVWVQVCVLAVQEVLGPRVFVREGWAPPAYDYHPVLREDEEGAMMPIGFAQAGEEDGEASLMSKSGDLRGRGKRVFDCAICMQTIEVPVVPEGGAAEGGTALSGHLLARRAYMVTPCRHIFHTNCLEGWMRYRLQCPICRETLPPL